MAIRKIKKGDVLRYNTLSHKNSFVGVVIRIEPNGFRIRLRVIARNLECHCPFAIGQLVELIFDPSDWDFATPNDINQFDCRFMPHPFRQCDGNKSPNVGNWDFV